MDYGVPDALMRCLKLQMDMNNFFFNCVKAYCMFVHCSGFLTCVRLGMSFAKKQIAAFLV